MFSKRVKAFLIVAGMGLAGASSVRAGDRNDKTVGEVVYRYVGQGQVILPVDQSRRDEPYALTGQQEVRRVNHWSTRGHYLNAGQTRIFIPATRQ